MLELTKFGDISSEKVKPEYTGKKAGIGRHETKFNKKKHQDTRIGNRRIFVRM